MVFDFEKEITLPEQKKIVYVSGITSIFSNQKYSIFFRAQFKINAVKYTNTNTIEIQYMLML